MREQPLVVFVDFDGTITLRDATDAILEAFADPAWRDVEDAWLSGRIGSRECLAAQMALVSATRQQIDRLLDGIDIDPGFERVLDVCARRGVPVHLVSDGFDHCLRRILDRPALNLFARLAGSHVLSSGLTLKDGRWLATFSHPPEPCAHGCATCKPMVMAANAAGAVTVFAGDGMSDRYAAQFADIVFAKDKLAAFCERASIPYIPFDTLATVAGEIDRLLTVELAAPPAGSRKVIPAV